MTSSMSSAAAPVAPSVEAASAPTITAQKPRAVDDPVIHIEAMLLSGLVESNTKGTLIDLLGEMESLYPQGRFVVAAHPVARVYQNVTRGTADLGLPTLRLNPDGEAKLPYRLSTESHGKVNFVLYSSKRKPVTRATIQQAQSRQKFDLSIEAPAFDWGFPCQPFTTLEGALRKVMAGRLDAFLWAQEEADHVLRQLNLSGVQRSHYGEFEDVFLLPRTPRGDFVDTVVSRLIKKLRSSGRLQALYSRIHAPYDPWQPD